MNFDLISEIYKVTFRARVESWRPSGNKKLLIAQNLSEQGQVWCVLDPLFEPLVWVFKTDLLLSLDSAIPRLDQALLQQEGGLLHRHASFRIKSPQKWRFLVRTGQMGSVQQQIWGLNVANRFLEQVVVDIRARQNEASVTL